MSVLSDRGETYPGHGYSLPQLLYAAKRKLQETALSGRVAAILDKTEINALERDASQVLSLARSLKNSLAPINRTPPEVLSLIPDYFEDEDEDEDLITLTHVCRSWRETFISRSSLWARLNFKDVDKTRTYILRSKLFPLKTQLNQSPYTGYLDDAFTLVIPHLHRLKSLAIVAENLPSILGHFRIHAPLLEELDIDITGLHYPALDDALFNGDLSHLQRLSLQGVSTHLPWKNLANLRILALWPPPPGHGITELLDLFESAPLLCAIELEDSIPTFSDAPPGRMVHLHHLRNLSISADPPHSILLNHLCIPAGALLTSYVTFREGSPLLDYLPERSPNLKNLSHITAINLHFESMRKYVRLSGPSGDLRLLAFLERPGIDESTVDHQILRSLGPPVLSKIQRLAVSRYTKPNQADIENCSILRFFSSAHNLRTLILTECNDLPFVLALNPEGNPTKGVLCPKLEEIILHVESEDHFHIQSLIDMAKRRESKGAKLSSVTVTGLGKFRPGEEMFDLREYVVSVECRADAELPAWDEIPIGFSTESNRILTIDQSCSRT